MIIKKEFLLSQEKVPSFKEDTFNHPIVKGITNNENCKGNSKKRSCKEKDPDKIEICVHVSSGRECPFKEKCKYSHEINSYLLQKEPDISDTCPLIQSIGSCIYGLRCRFLKGHHPKHLISQGDSLKTVHEADKKAIESLRKHTYLFPNTKKYFEQKDDSQSIELENINKQSEEFDSPGMLFSIHPRERKLISFNDKLYLAPLTTVGNLPFRRVCKEFGADITCGEMALASNILKGHYSEWALLKRHSSEDIFGVQICGGNAELMSKCVEVIEREACVDFVDVNMGCPIDLIYEKGMGSALLDKPSKIESILKAMRSCSSLPITVKLRAGVYDGKLVAHKIIPRIKDLGISAATLHGRTRQQRYTKEADWDYIRQCSQLSSNIPFIGNGDVMSFEDYFSKLENSKVSTILLARGALIKPWLFTEIKERRHWDISSSERLEILRKYCDYGLEHFGTDEQGIHHTRRFLLEWLSFLYRYVPVGLLEVLPQRMNDRPPKFIGRNDLETLMASEKVSDWIKLRAYLERLLFCTQTQIKLISRMMSSC